MIGLNACCCAIFSFLFNSVLSGVVAGWLEPADLIDLIAW